MRKDKKKANEKANQKAREAIDAYGKANEEVRGWAGMVDKKGLLKLIPLSYDGKILQLIKRGEFPPARRGGRKNLRIVDELKAWAMNLPVVELKPVRGLKGYKPEQTNATS
jgi:hypothetical protein